MSDDNDNIFELLTGGAAATPDMEEAAAQIFAMYTSFVEAGFTPDQAMQLLLSMLPKG